MIMGKPQIYSQYAGFSLGRLHMGGQVQGDKALMGGGGNS